jgi:hypothetical protein
MSYLLIFYPNFRVINNIFTGGPSVMSACGIVRWVAPYVS